MTNLQKKKITEAIRSEINRYGSAARVANKVGVSKATLSNMLNGKWEKISNELWQSVANRLNVRFDSWQVVAEITNTRMLTGVFNTARRNRMFIPVSYQAGSGKSQAAKLFVQTHPDEAIYYLNAREWGKREFLLNLMQTLGLEPPKGVVTVDKLGEMVINFFVERTAQNPLLIIDEADKLKPSALRFLIHLFNYTEDRLGVVIMGTEHLEKEIKRGVRLAKKGYDEIDSRFGRNYIKLIGATRKDVEKICVANGITDKTKQKSVFDEAGPTEVRIHTGDSYEFIRVVKDLRRVKRIIQREILKSKTYNYDTINA